MPSHAQWRPSAWIGAALPPQVKCGATAPTMPGAHSGLQYHTLFPLRSLCLGGGMGPDRSSTEGEEAGHRAWIEEGDGVLSETGKSQSLNEMCVTKTPPASE